MKNRICPRCGKKIPPWQPVHIPCLAYRLRYAISAFGVVLALILGSRLYRPTAAATVTGTPTVVAINDATKTRAPVPRATLTLIKKTSTPVPPVTPTRPATATKTTVAHVQPTTPFDWSKCHATYSTRLKIGDAVVIGNYSSPFGYTVLTGPYNDREKAGVISPGDRATIVNGPSCSNKWIWWIIALEKNDVTGWIPEGDSASYWLSLADGDSNIDNARISNNIYRVSLRRSPGYLGKNDQQDVLVEIPRGEIVRLLNGPQTADGLNWWYVGWNGYEGWIAEKTASGKIIMIFNP